MHRINFEFPIVHAYDQALPSAWPRIWSIALNHLSVARAFQLNPGVCAWAALQEFARSRLSPFRIFSWIARHFYNNL